MMLNRPEFNLCDTAAMHLGATPFSIYNTSAPEQIAYLFGNAENRVVFCEERFAAGVMEAGGKVEHIVCVDGRPEGTISLAELEERSERSEEHTSELQSPCNLVCRLLLEQ